MFMVQVPSLNRHFWTQSRFFSNKLTRFNWRSFQPNTGIIMPNTVDLLVNKGCFEEKRTNLLTQEQPSLIDKI